MLIGWRGSFTPAEKTKMRDWLARVAGHVTLLHGTLPRSPIRAVLRPYAASEAVPFAQVIRSAPEGVTFYVNPDRPLEEFVRDWTAYHEFSHLFIPYPSADALWFSEGLASFYQNVLQYRAGLLDEREAWQKLRNGFQRGREDDAHDGTTLADVSTSMIERRAFMRTYWSGALYFLEADIALRERSAGRLSLDAVLRDYGLCCLQQAGRVRGEAIAAEFDRIAGIEVFAPLYGRYAASRRMPDYERVLASAGIALARARIEPLANPGSRYSLDPAPANAVTMNFSSP